MLGRVGGDAFVYRRCWWEREDEHGEDDDEHEWRHGHGSMEEEDAMEMVAGRINCK